MFMNWLLGITSALAEEGADAAAAAATALPEGEQTVSAAAAIVPGGSAGADGPGAAC